MVTMTHDDPACGDAAQGLQLLEASASAVRPYPKGPYEPRFLSGCGEHITVCSKKLEPELGMIHAGGLWAGRTVVFHLSGFYCMSS